MSALGLLAIGASFVFIRAALKGESPMVTLNDLIGRAGITRIKGGGFRKGSGSSGGRKR